MRRNKGILAACIVAALALAIAIAGTAAGAPGHSKASKRCKRMHSTKKRCKKRKADMPRSPLIRATLTWSNGGENADMDLFVFDGNGGVAGAGSDTIPLSSMTPDFSGPAGYETFTDGLFTPQSVRDLSFGVCYARGAPVPTNFTLTYVTADGAVHGDTQTAGQTTRFDYPGGVAIPSGFCSR
jgi:hypothetical protein